jgi:polo-like kinase 1
MELQKRRKTVTETEARYFLKQIMLAVNYLHDKNIVHRDLKLGNIFINDHMNLKLGDFGLATTIEFNGERKKTLCGTPNYIAPEVLAKKGHSFEVDIWSIGCILYTLLVGKPPFETHTLKDTYAKIKRGEYNFPQTKVTASARQLIQNMLQVDPTRRPTASQILASEFIGKLYIPSSLPASCLTTQPRFDGRPSYAPVPQPFKGDPKRQPLVEHNNPRSPAGVPSAPAEQKISSTAGYMKDLRNQMKTVLSKDLDKRRTNDDDAEDPNAAPLLWISKWVDYSDKYGFGYQLSDDSIGVSFNDLTRMVLLPDGQNMHYIDKNGLEHYHTRDKYPTAELQKKVKLLNYFQQYMSENLLRAGGNIPSSETASMTRLPSMWTWFRTSRAVVMVLTNGTLQINNFRDHTKMILCPLLGAITTLEHGKPMRTFKFSLIEQYGCTPDLRQKLQYALEKLDVVMGTKCAEQNSAAKSK